jgi:hypothetical protein
MTGAPFTCPAGVAIGEGTVWVASRSDDRLIPVRHE